MLPRGPIVVPFGGSYIESYKVNPKRNYYGAYGEPLTLDLRFSRHVLFSVASFFVMSAHVLWPQHKIVEIRYVHMAAYAYVETREVYIYIYTHICKCNV